MWKAINNGVKAGVGSLVPSPMPVKDGIYVLLYNYAIPGKSAIVVKVDESRHSVEDAIRAAEAYRNRRSAERYATEGGVIDMYGNTILASRPVASLLT